MNLNLVALAATAVASISLGIAVYQRTPDRVWNRLFAAHATFVGLWAFCNFLIMASDSPGEAGTYLRLSHPLVVLGICTIVDFAWVFPDRIDYEDNTHRMVLYATGLVFGTVGFAPNLYHSIELGPGIVHVQYGWPLIPFGIFAVTALAYADLVLLRKALRLEGVQRVQVIWVLVGIAGTHLVALSAIIIIPIVWKTTAYSGWGASGVIIQLAGMGYAIAKHRLMQPRMALRRVAATALSVAVVVTIALGALHVLNPLLTSKDVPLGPVYIILGLLLGLLIVLMHDRVTRLIGRVLSSGGDPESVQSETASHILRTLDADQLLDYLAEALEGALEPTNVVVYTRNNQNGSFTPRAWLPRRGDRRDNGHGMGPDPLSIDNQIARAAVEGDAVITRDQIFRFESLGQARSLAVAMDDLDAQVVSPMVWEDDLIGLVTLGPKESGEMYSDSELRFVGDMSLQASLALRNAELYAETAALKEFNERILRQMDNAVIVTDGDEQIVVFNEAAADLFGIEGAVAVGSSIEILPERIAGCIRASLGTGRALSGRHLEIESDGRTIPLACSTSPVEGEGEASQGVVAVISDLTVIKELDEERQEAERLALIRMISAGMAHEIRNPLVAIRTFAELAPKRLDDPEFRSNFLTVAQQEIKRIDSLVGDLLSLSKPADAVVESVNLEKICRDVTRSTTGMAEAKGIDVDLNLGEIEGTINGDETRLHQALLNLMSNAIDAEPENGRVSVAVSQETNGEGDETVRLRVHNPGSFIPPDDLDEIFRPFVSKKREGTGLGLAICQTIVEEHNGIVCVESSQDGGTEFTMELPLSNTKMVSRAGDG